MKIKIYCNYGCLSAEKRNVYTYGCPDSTATCWDEMTVEIPEGWEAYENYMGRLVVTAPWGTNYIINEVLEMKSRVLRLMIKIENCIELF